MNNREFFQNLNPSSYIKIETQLSRGEGSNTQTFKSEITIRIAHYEPIMYVTVWNGLHLAKHARFIEDEPGVEIPAYKGEGDDPQIRDWKEYFSSIVLDLNGRQWVGQTWNRSFEQQTEFMFHFNPKGDAHALLLASDLIQHTCVFAPHLELGIDGMA
jgi:hypothetical protein